MARLKLTRTPLPQWPIDPLICRAQDEYHKRCTWPLLKHQERCDNPRTDREASYKAFLDETARDRATLYASVAARRKVMGKE